MFFPFSLKLSFIIRRKERRRGEGKSSFPFSSNFFHTKNKEKSGS
jgi:hypothetical protein